MAKKTISNTFTVNTVEDGVDAQYIYLKGTARDNNSSVTTAIDCVVNVNGGTNLVTTEARGLNLVIINRQTLAIVDSINYDTYGEAAETGTGITNLIAKLNALDNSVFVCLVSYDAIGWSSSLITALQGYGMSDLPYTATGRYPFLFIGYKNLGKGNGLTRMRDAGNYYDVVEASVYIANGALTMKDGKDGIDGDSAPYYFQEWFAWSNDASTASVTTPPSISGSWETSIPAQGSYAYLWRKSIRNVWNSNSRTYTQEAAQYFRMSGLDGTSINVKGTILGVAHNDGEADSYSAQTVEGNKFFIDIQNYPVTLQTYSNGQWSSSSPSDGDAYTSSGNGHLYMYSQEASHVLDLGLFQGQNGKTFYTHVAWATNVVYSGGRVTSVEGFVTTKSPNDTTHLWMGVLIDEIAGQDSTKATEYAWSYTKGVQGNPGNDAVRYELVPSVNVITLDEDEVPIFDYVFFSLYRTVGSNNPTIYSTVQQWQNGLFQLYYVVDGVITEVDYDYMLSYDTKVNYHDIESLYETNHEVTWVVKKNNSVIAQLSMGVVKNGEKGNTGARGKVGRFFYFGGVFDSSNTNTSFVVNDAQAPYFEHTVDGQKRYHVFNYDTNGTYTMAQMWAISSNWNNAPWEVMTNDFKYIITEALFSAYAHLGSFIINGDWAISQYGVIYDANGEAHNIDSDNASWGTYNKNNAYTLFNPSYPDSSRPNYNNFCPNFAVDGKTGETYQNAAHIRGEVHATSGEFTGDITAKGGSIGGFTIDDNGKRLANSDWNAGVDISTNDGRNVKIGKNAQGDIDTESAIIRAENTRVSQTYNTALFLNAKKATYNYAFYGNGNGVLNGYVQGYRVKSFQFSSSTTRINLNLNDGMVQVLTEVYQYNEKWIYLPTLSNIKLTLGISDNNTDFTCRLVIINMTNIQSGYEDYKQNVYVRGDDRAATGVVTDGGARPRIVHASGSYYMHLGTAMTAEFNIMYINGKFVASYIWGASTPD